MPKERKKPTEMTQEALLAWARKAAKNIPNSIHDLPARKELPSTGLSCTCFGKMHPDPDCPMHCGDVFR